MVEVVAAISLFTEDPFFSCRNIYYEKPEKALSYVPSSIPERSMRLAYTIIHLAFPSRPQAPILIFVNNT